MNVLALTRYGRLGASSRMRTYQYVPVLKKHGINFHVMPLLRDDYVQRLYAKRSINWIQLAADYLRQALRLINVKKFDLVWIEKELFPNLPAWGEQLFAALGVPYVVDYDDAIFHNYDISNNPLKRLLSKKIDKVMENAALVVCGNRYLAQRAQRAGARCVETVPTAVELQRYIARTHVKSEQVTIGWIGSPATIKYLHDIVPALQEASIDLPIRVHVIGANLDVPGVEVNCLSWSEENEANEICSFDIGVMPLPDSSWERGKCGYKLIQYMACGVPAIASPVGVNNEIVEHGVNGYLALSKADWVSALRRLGTDFRLRQIMGMQGRVLVEQQYCLDVTGPYLAQLLHNVVTA